MGIKEDYYLAVMNTSPDAWKALDFKGRELVLQIIENGEALLSGRAARKLNFIPFVDKDGMRVMGSYTPDFDNCIFLNFFNLDDPELMLSTLFHEGRHAYQMDCVRGKLYAPDFVREQYAEGFRMYEDPERNEEAYHDCLTERDARAHAEKKMNALHKFREQLLNAHAARQDAARTRITPASEYRVEAERPASFAQELYIGSMPGDEAVHPVKVKSLSRDTVSRGEGRVLTNGEVMAYCDQQMMLDAQSARDAIDHVPKERLRQLGEACQEEYSSYQMAQMAYQSGDARAFESSVNYFLAEHEQLHEQLPVMEQTYQTVQQEEPDWSYSAKTVPEQENQTVQDNWPVAAPEETQDQHNDLWAAAQNRQAPEETEAHALWNAPETEETLAPYVEQARNHLNQAEPERNHDYEIAY